MIRYYRGMLTRSSRGGDGKLTARAGRGLAGTAAMVFGVVVCLLLAGGGVAQGAPNGFGNGEGDESGQFRNPQGIAVDRESGDVYVADTGNSRVEKFSGDGAFLFAWGWGVADGHAEALQTCTTNCFAGIYGAGSGQLREPKGVVVDNDPLSASYRDVYVADSGNNRVEKFDSAGDFLLMFGGGVNETSGGNVCLAGEACGAGTPGTEPGEFERFGESSGIAVDSAGNVFIGDLNRVEEFSPGGVYTGQITIPGAGSIKAVAVDSSGDVYANGSELSGVRKYDLSGTELGEPRDASGEFTYSARSFVTQGASGEVFIADGEGKSGHIHEYNPSGGEVASFDAVSFSAGNECGGAGIAFSNGIGGLYVLNQAQARVRVVSPPPPGPLVVSESAGELQPTTTGVSAVVNPEGHATTYRVEYGTTTSYGSSTPLGSLSGSAFEEESVSVGLSELQPRTVYHFRVVAASSAGTTFGADETFATLPPVLIDSESASNATSTAATFTTQINPLGRDTRYRFEYGPSLTYGSSVPVPDGDAGSGTSDVPLSALVERLTPGTVYHYRVVASNSLGAVDGPDHVFETQSGEAPALPDGRAWEMVSPPDKRGIALEAIGDRYGAEIQAAADGNSITYVAQGPIDAEPKGNRSFAAAQILSKRTAGGWSSLDVTTPHEKLTGVGLLLVGFAEYRVFSPDLSVGLVEPVGDTPLASQATEKTPYQREANGEYTPLITAANVPAGTKFGQVEEGGAEFPGDVAFRGASADLSHVVLESSPPLTEGIADTEGRHNLFEWAGGSPRLVSVLPNGRAATEEEENAGLGNGGDVRHAVSDDGSRIFWNTNNRSGEGALYMRDVSRGETVRLDAVQSGARGGGGSLAFASASSDGSRVFFTDESRLTPDSKTAAFAPDLYLCEMVEVAGKLACRLKDVTADHNAGEVAGVQGTVIAGGEDGRYAYFVANGVLAAGATPGDCSNGGAPGQVCNLYVYDAVTGEVRFIAQLPGDDNHDWVASGVLGYLTAGASPNGRYLAFMSEKSLTGYDNIDAHSGQPDVETFLYDVSTGRVTCASCNPSGARPSGVFDPGGFPGLLVDRGGFGGGNWGGHWLAGSVPGWTNATALTAFYRSRYLSDSGRLFFDSADALVPRDANGAEDVYEYEPSGVGGCARAGGCVGLVSSGTSGEESAFLDASDTGNDVFFLTAARLVPQDLDNAFDVYDARACSASSPCLASPPAQSPPCATADSCRAAPSQQPGVFGAPPSATFSGARNLQPEVSKPTAKKKVLSVAQKRAAALRKCRVKPTRRRMSCEAQARRRYRIGVKAKRSVRSPIQKGNR